MQHIASEVLYSTRILVFNVGHDGSPVCLDSIGVVYRCPNITKQNNEKIHNAISEVSKGDCIIMGDFNHGNIKWD